MMIPKMFHWYWEGETDERAVANLTAWRDLHPTWEVRVWSPTVHPCVVLADQFNHADRYGRNPAVVRSNLVRYEALQGQGGVWIDADMKPVKPLDSLLVNVEAFIARDLPTQVQTSIMGCTPQHPWMAAIVEAQLEQQPHPPRLNGGVRIVNQATGDSFPGLTIFPAEYFYPLRHADGKQLTDPIAAYAIHETWNPIEVPGD